jgi:hypothetical protein
VPDHEAVRRSHTVEVTQDNPGFDRRQAIGPVDLSHRPHGTKVKDDGPFDGRRSGVYAGTGSVRYNRRTGLARNLDD